MEVLIGLAVIAGIQILGVMSPGPDFAIVVRNSLVGTRANGIATAAGITAGNILYIGIALAGLGVVLASSALVFTVVKYLGAAYLVYLGVRLMLSKKTELEAETHDHAADSVRTSFIQGFLTNLANPKFIVYVIALFSQVITPDTAFAVQILYGAIIPVIAMIWFTVLSIAITTPSVRTRISAYLHRIEQAMGVFLVGLGLNIVLNNN